jgi:hypothetical protein
LLFERAAVDEVAGLNNRSAMFPIHRSLKFVLLTASTGHGTDEIRCRFGISDADSLNADQPPLVITRAFVARVSGSEDLGIPEILSATDLRVMEHITATTPPLGDSAGWNVHFGRELNASDDSAAFTARCGATRGRVVLEGKHIEPFRVHLDRAARELTAETAAARRIRARARLAYRDVTSAGNKLTLIAAVIPARAVTTHTLFVLREPLAMPRQLMLCALLNSYVANYLIRMRVGTHVTSGLIARLPVPCVSDVDPRAAALASLVERLRRAVEPPEEADEHAELQAIAAHLYGLNAAQFTHVLATFPLVQTKVRQAALMRFVERAERSAAL